MAALYGDLPEAKLIEAPKVTPISTSDQLDKMSGEDLKKKSVAFVLFISPRIMCR